MDEPDKKKIRKLAEKTANENPVSFPDVNSEDYTSLLQELNVHQIELELQNEELQNTQVHLKYNKNIFAQLFNSTPVSFIVLNSGGISGKQRRLFLEATGPWPIYDINYLEFIDFTNNYLIFQNNQGGYKVGVEIHYESSETDRLEMLLSALPIGIVIIDCNTRKIVDLNPQALVYFDLPLDQLVGKTCNDHICPSEKGNCPILDKGQTLDQSEREIITGDGSKMPVLKTVIEAEFDDRAVLIECIIDMRDKIFAQKEHLEREKIETVLEMAGAICHEFNQPLQVILGFCELMKGEILELRELPEKGQALTEKMLKNVESIMSGVDKMSSLTRSLSNVTKYETKPYLNSKIMDLERSST